MSGGLMRVKLASTLFSHAPSVLVALLQLAYR
jgi:hypothetical protein